MAVAVLLLAPGEVAAQDDLSVEVVPQIGHTDHIWSVEFSPDGRLVLSAGREGVLKLWEAATGKLLRSFYGVARVRGIAVFSSDGRSVIAATADGKISIRDTATGEERRSLKAKGSAPQAVSPSLKLWRLTTGELVRDFAGQSEPVGALALSPDGRSLLIGGASDYDFNTKSRENRLRLWDVRAGALTHTFAGHPGQIRVVAFSPDGRTALSGIALGRNDSTITLWDMATTRLQRTLEGHHFVVTSAAFASDGSLVSVGEGDNTLKLWDADSGKLLRTGEISSKLLQAEATGNLMWKPQSVTVSPDGAHIATGSLNTLRIWDRSRAKLLRTFDLPSGSIYGLAYLPDGRRILLGTEGHVLQLLDMTNGTTRFTGSSRWSTTRPAWVRDSWVTSLALSRDSRMALSGSVDQTLKLWDIDTGGLVRAFKGHASKISSVGMSADGRTGISGSADGTARLWSLSDGRELLRLLAAGKDGWLAITPDGFFNASSSASDLVAVVRGVEGYEIAQLWHSLFSPDLVRETLAGDVRGEVRQAADVVNLKKVVGSGPPPAVAIVSPLEGSQSPTDIVTVTARLEDRGKGVGRIEWRVNGVTAAVADQPADGGPAFTIARELALDPGDNAIEVVAYNRANLLASLPARTTVTFTEAADKIKPNLHVLAIGINGYTDKGWAEPGKQLLAFGPLGLAVKDATALGERMKKAASSLYGEVLVTLALDGQATRDKLEQTVAKIAGEIKPRDSFILFAAAHGASENGRFYLIPQDYQSGRPGTLAQHAIGQDDLQRWLANLIKARRALILLDTCESGAAVAGHVRSRAEAPASEAAVGRLHEATGRPVLTAAAEGQYAYEGLIGDAGERHGVFTWALLDALSNGDSNGNGLIELSELVRHVQSLVPKVADGLARAVVPEPLREQQSARFGSRGEDFALAHRLR